MYGHLRDINFEVKQGEVIGNYWAKWSGKSHTY